MKPLQQRATYGNFLCCKLACKCTELFGAVAWAATSDGTCGVGYSNVYDQGGFLLSKPLRWRNRPVPCTSDGSGSTLFSNFRICWVSLSNIILYIYTYSQMTCVKIVVFGESDWRTILTAWCHQIQHPCRVMPRTSMKEELFWTLGAAGAAGVPCRAGLRRHVITSLNLATSGH